MQKVIISREELYYLYNERHFSLRDLCRHYCHDARTLLKLFREHNLSLRNGVEAWQIRKQKKTPPQITRDTLYIEYILRRKSTDAIALEYNIPSRTVRRCLKRYVITPRIRCPKFDTSIERLMEDELAEREIGHYKQYPIQYSIDHMCVADKAFPDEKIAIFCDGTYWHSRDWIKIKDERVNRALADRGWTVLRFTEQEIHADIERVVDTIESVLQRRNHTWVQDPENGKRKVT